MLGMALNGANGRLLGRQLYPLSGYAGAHLESEKWPTTHLKWEQTSNVPSACAGQAESHENARMNSFQFNMAAPLADGTQPDASQAESTDAGQWLNFCGATSCGPVGIALADTSDAPGPVSGVRQVLCLAQAEPLIDQVEQWLQSAWDPAPTDAGACLAGYRAVVRDPALAPPGTVLTVPQGALRTSPPDALRAPALSWRHCVARLWLSEVPHEALSQMELGCLLWLPASFGKEWQVRLLDPAHGLPACTARFDLQAKKVTVPPQTRVKWPDEGEIEPAGALSVMLTAPVALPLECWLGWADGTPLQWPVSPPLEAELWRDGSVLAAGSLMLAGDGCGLLVTSMGAATDALPAKALQPDGV